METDVSHERLQAHALLDMLTDEKLNVVRSLLEVMIEPATPEPLALSLAQAPLDDS